jgi:hypothetical protein
VKAFHAALATIGDLTAGLNGVKMASATFVLLGVPSGDYDGDLMWRHHTDKRNRYSREAEIAHLTAAIPLRVAPKSVKLR